MPFPQGNSVAIIEAKQFEDEYLTSTSRTDGRVVSQVEVLNKWDATLRHEGFVHKKITEVHAKRTTEEGIIDTVVDGKIESRRSYDKGDYIVCGSRGGRYPMSVIEFTSRYDISRTEPASEPVLASAGFKRFKAKGKVGLCPYYP